jgi:hypothetical protein
MYDVAFTDKPIQEYHDWFASKRSITPFAASGRKDPISRLLGQL